ncbi:MAG: hypothetical protein GC179_23420 [Anaerolineaceae bacterium]|nr:hypothetical protein [Anaerolineaceae bacterium]
MYRMNGYRDDWGYRGGWRRGPHPMFFFPALLLAGFIFFGLFKFFFPLILLAVVFMAVKAMMRGGFGGRGSWGRWHEDRREFWNQGWNWENRWGDHWHDKRKHDWMNDEKPKNDDSGDDQPRYTRAPNGEWVEIV